MAGGVLLVACASGGGSGAGTSGVPDAAMAARAGVSLDTIGEGYWVYQRKCSECHEAKRPNDHEMAGWHATVGGMAWNAGLSEGESELVLAYMDAAGK